MGIPQVKTHQVSDGHFHLDIPISGTEEGIRRFREEFLRMFEEAEFPIETSRVKRRGSIFFFEIATDLSKEKIETLASRALEKIKMRKEG